ncbi:GlmU family protein [Aquimarina intermedia]|uniref:UDP-N-acetylglucosamine diphosphorylase/glucosamine-1-phosphate N-acetyltransferase n=1 Tax=Aquimarina intermedia TaxID=350814 RepID=A0A5S5BWZ2_9FLAO|nr:GlmU family protein [Aquimarina intermedia]TYP71685.1 UDP-N-acetylglucosamine diphosphorylase/glucosamine-1-phosphate N-acetyltransferase [Aquimarina intermedia]
MNYILFDGSARNALLPFTFTRPIAEIRIGILTIREKWESYLGSTTSTVTEEYLSEKFPMVELAENVMINASYLPTPTLVEAIKSLQPNQGVFIEGEPVAFYVLEGQEVALENYEAISFDQKVETVKTTWDIFAKNGTALQADFDLLTEGRTSAPLDETNTCIHPENIFVEEGASISCAIINATDGPVYIAKDAHIMEGSIIRGPFALCEGATVKMGAKIYGPTTIGPFSKVGGEVNNSVLFGYSNKGHDGFLGNSVIGEWCNLGADTNTSNLKNNYAPVRLWSYETENFAKTGLQFCGLMMGDHSKCGINTMFNTGTMIGVNANIFGSGFPRNFIPSYSWGGSNGFTTYLTKKAFEVAKVVMSRRSVEFTEMDEKILEHVFEITQQWRTSYDK